MLKRPRSRRQERGFATIEMIPVMVVIALLLNFSLGFYGIIQTALLNSIAARNYTFETFRNRTNLLYFHDIRGAGNNFKKFNARVHGIVSETRPASADTDAYATLRRIGYGASPPSEDDPSVHEPGGSDEQGIFGIKAKERNTSITTSPVWIRPMYGICLNAKCSQ